MDRVGIDPKYKGGLICMAAASAVVDRGVLIDVVLNTGRWANWQIFNKFLQPSLTQSGGLEHWLNFVINTFMGTGYSLQVQMTSLRGVPGQIKI